MRRRTVLRSVVFVLLWLVLGVARANTGTIDISCTSVKFTYTSFATQAPSTVSETVLLDGATVATRTFVFTASGTDTLPIDVPSTGTHVVVARSNWTTNGTSRSISKTVQFTAPACPGPCPGAPDPAGAHATGNAFGLKIGAPLLSLTAQPKAASSQSGIGSSHQDDILLSINLPGIATVGVLGVATTGTVTADPFEARDTSLSEIAGVSLLGGVIKADNVRANVEAIARGDSSATSAAGTTFSNLVVNGVQYNNVPPNTRIGLPLVGTGAYVILNEQIRSTSGPAPGQRSGGTYGASITVNMIHVVLPGLLRLPPTEVIVAHAQAQADFPQTTTCTPTSAQSVSGHAFVARAGVDALFGLDVLVGHVAIPPTGGSVTQAFDTLMLPGIGGPTVNSAAASSSSLGTLSPTNSTATSNASVERLSLLSGAITATLVKTQANSAASSGGASSNPTGTQLLNLVVGGKALGNNPPPNTTLNLPGIGFVVFNEQIPDAPSPGHTGLTVRAIHVHVNKLGGVIPGAEIIVSEAHSDATF